MNMTNTFVKNRKHIRPRAGDLVYLAIVAIFLCLMLIIIVFPMLNMFSLGFSNGIYNDKILFLPKGITFASFSYVLKEFEFLISFRNSLLITVAVTLLSTLCMALAAYPMSKQDFPFKKAIMILFLIPMLFSPGIVPSYMLVKSMGMLNSLAPLILLSIFNTFNLLLIKTFFENQPTSIVEAAKIDGAGELQLFFRVVIPMAVPVIATTAFYTIFGTWNNYSGAMIFCQTNVQAQPLAYYIYKMLGAVDVGITDKFKIINKLNIQSAAIMISMLPILIVYPFVMRNLKDGLTIGSDKG